MTRSEAESVVSNCREYISFQPGLTTPVTLDGDFTVEQLEAVLTLLRDPGAAQSMRAGEVAAT